jgi:hypothetical protein
VCVCGVAYVILRSFDIKLLVCASMFVCKCVFLGLCVCMCVCVSVCVRLCVVLMCAYMCTCMHAPAACCTPSKGGGERESDRDRDRDREGVSE